MGLIGLYKCGCEHLLSLLCISLCMRITTTIGVPCTLDENICGCVFTNSTGGKWQISMLKINKDGSPFFSKIKGKSGAFNYFINPCTGFTDEGCSDVTGCQESTDGKSSFSIAKPGTYKFGPYTEGKPLTVTYDAVEGRQMTLSLVCTPPSYKDTATVDDDVSDKYIVTISSKKVCPEPFRPPTPSKPSSSGGLSTCSILVFIFFVVLVIYLVAVIIFMKYKRRAIREKVIPNVEFWSTNPGPVKVQSKQEFTVIA